MSRIKSHGLNGHTSRFRISLTLLLVGLILIWPVSTPLGHTASSTNDSTASYSTNVNEPSQSLLNPISIDPKLLSSPKDNSPQPKRIIIPSLNIDLPITPSQIVNGFWQLSPTTASFGLGSAVPGEPGNIVIFAHARPALFLPLRQITKDTRVYVLTEKQWHSYSVNQITKVKPNQTEVISATNSEELTLYTCSGFQDSLRLIVKAIPLK